MLDIKLAFGDGQADLASLGFDLETDDSLTTAVVVSLFTDRLADAADELPAGETDRRGWWADSTLPPATSQAAARIGSKLWLIRREKQTEPVRLAAEQYCREALQWLVDDRLAVAVFVSAAWVSRGLLGIRVQLDAREINLNYPWEA